MRKKLMNTNAQFYGPQARLTTHFKYSKTGIELVEILAEVFRSISQ